MERRTVWTGAMRNAVHARVSLTSSSARPETSASNTSSCVTGRPTAETPQTRAWTTAVNSTRAHTHTRACTHTPVHPTPAAVWRDAPLQRRLRRERGQLRWTAHTHTHRVRIIWVRSGPQSANHLSQFGIADRESFESVRDRGARIIWVSSGPRSANHLSQFGTAERESFEFDWCFALWRQSERSWMQH